MIHRDIKSGNVLVNNHGVVKLADFGCSKLVTSDDSATEAGFNNLKGTTFWMAPEVINKSHYSVRSDIWSLGCTIVEMYTGTGRFPYFSMHHTHSMFGQLARDTT